MKSIAISLVLVGVFISGCAIGTRSQSVVTDTNQPAAKSATNVEDRQLIQLQVGSSTLIVEAVTSSESITKGLGEREEIGSDGMIFFLPDRRVATFWMKGMLFPLDMVWIDGDSVIGVTANIPIHASDAKFPTYASPAEVTQVLELPAGDAQKRGIKAGDQVLVTSN